jgi:hypothetical protein
MDRVVLGHFVRQGRPLLVLVNAGAATYSGSLRTALPGAWVRLDPGTGAVARVASSDAGELPLDLGARQAVILVGPPERASRQA